jgi:hypothetical protein
MQYNKLRYKPKKLFAMIRDDYQSVVGLRPKNIDVSGYPIDPKFKRLTLKFYGSYVIGNL